MDPFPTQTGPEKLYHDSLIKWFKMKNFKIRKKSDVKPFLDVIDSFRERMFGCPYYYYFLNGEAVTKNHSVRKSVRNNLALQLLTQN